MKLQRTGTRLAFAVSASAALLLATPFASRGQDIPITTRSQEARELYTKGQEALEASQLDLAREFFTKAVEKDDSFAMAYYSRAFTGEPYEEYTADLKKASELSKNASVGEQLYVEATIGYLFGESLDQRQEAAEKLLAMFPNSEQALYSIAGICSDRGDHKKALGYYEKLASLRPTKGNVFNSLGYARMYLRDNEGAEQAFRRYVELSPNIANSHDSYAEALLQVGKYDASIQEYQKALELDPAFISSLGGLGGNYVFKGDYTKAREYYDQMFTQAKDNPTKWRAKQLAAISYLHEGENDGALKIMNELVEMKKQANDPGAVWNLADAGRILLERGRGQEALPYLDRAFALLESMSVEPSIKEWATLFLTFSRAITLADAGKTDDAKAEVSKLRTIAGNVKEAFAMYLVHEAQGRIESSLGNEAAALAEFNQGDLLSPQLLYCKARSQMKTGKEDEARLIFQQIAGMRRFDHFGLAIVRPLAIKALDPMQAGGGR